MILSELVRGRLFTSTRPDQKDNPISQDLQSVIRRATQGNPADRYGSVQEFSDHLEECLIAGRTVSARPETAERASPPSDPGSVSVAVLPFHTFKTADSTDEYLGVGLADALITKLSNVRAVSVKPTGSVLRFAGRRRPADRRP